MHEGSGSGNAGRAALIHPLTRGRAARGARARRPRVEVVARRGGSGGTNPRRIERMQMRWLEHKPRTTAHQVDSDDTVSATPAHFPTMPSSPQPEMTGPSSARSLGRVSFSAPAKSKYHTRGIPVRYALRVLLHR